jgi:PAS domain S-box-containing protein
MKKHEIITLIKEVVAKDNFLEIFLSTLNHPAVFLLSNGEIISHNKIFLKLYGLKESAILKKNIFDVFKEYNIRPPYETISKAINRKKSIQTIISRNHNREVSKTIQWTASNINLSNKEKAILIIGLDITSFISASKKESNIKDFIIDHIHNHYIFWKDKNSVYLGCNKALANAIGLKSSNEIIGKTDYDLPTTKEQSDSYRADDKFVMDTKIPKLNIEEKQTLNDGEIRIISTSKAPLMDNEGNVYGVLAIYSDITDIKNKKEDLFLFTDKFLFDNNVLIDTLFKNINKMSQYVK